MQARTSVKPDCCKPFDEIRTGGKADCCEKPREADRIEEPERRLGDAGETAVHGAQPAEHEPTQQSAHAHAEPDLELAEMQCEQTNQPACHDGDAYRSHVGRRREAIDIPDP